MGRSFAVHVLLAATALLPVPARAAGPWGIHRTPKGLRADVDGRAETPAGTVAAVLRVQCRDAGGGGMLCVSVKIEDAARSEGFDFASLETASANGGAPRLLLHDGEASVEAEPEGRWAQDPPGSFALSVCGKAGAASEARHLADLVAAGAGPLELAVRSASGEIRMHFPADSEDRVSRKVVKRCSSR